jgi:hypothetical protein
MCARESYTRMLNNCFKRYNLRVVLCLHNWKEDYTRQSQPPASGAPLGEQRFEFWFL